MNWQQKATWALKNAVRFVEHQRGCKVYPTSRGGSAYDADDEQKCSCGLNAWKKAIKALVGEDFDDEF